MTKQKPESGDWLALYQAAAAFKEQGSWEWLLEEHLYGVENPAGGEIGYCCVLGHLGEVFALNVYIGADGLAGLLKMQNPDSGDLFEMMGVQKSLMASFDDRSDLDPVSLKQIKELGLKFRGSGEWPNFRSYEPGYVPWRLTTRDEVRFLTLCLEHTVELADRYRNRTDELHPLEGGEILIMVPEGANGSRTWKETRMVPPGIDEALESFSQPVPMIDELRLNRIRKNTKGRTGIWEIDAFYAPMPIEDPTRPFFPQLGMIVDQNSGQILHYQMSQGPGEKLDLSDGLLEIVERLLVIPEQVWVLRDEIYRSLDRLMKVYEIPLVRVDELPLLQEAREGMFTHFAGE